MVDCFKNLAIILISAKLMGLLAKKCKAPQVVGQILAGLIIGQAVLGLVAADSFIKTLAEIGVVILMFSAGLETNLRDLLKTSRAVRSAGWRSCPPWRRIPDVQYLLQHQSGRCNGRKRL